MKLLRAIFYFVAILTLCEVLEIRLLSQLISPVSHASGWMESPPEEDESRESEDEDEFYCHTPVLLPESTLASRPVPASHHFGLPELCKPILVPPPKG